MAIIDELKIKQPVDDIKYELYSNSRIFGDSRPRLIYYALFPFKVVEITGYLKNSDDTKIWFIKGIKSTAQEVFESLSDEDKEKAIWYLDEWK